LPALSRPGALVAPPCSVSTSRSSNRTGGFPASGSRMRHQVLGPRKTAHEHLRREQPERAVQVLIRIESPQNTSPLVFQAQPPAESLGSVPINRPICVGDRTQGKVLGPTPQYPVHVRHDLFDCHPCGATIGRISDGSYQTMQALLRRPTAQIGSLGLTRVASSEGVSQEVKVVVRYTAQSGLLLVHRQLQLLHGLPHR